MEELYAVRKKKIQQIKKKEMRREKK